MSEKEEDRNQIHSKWHRFFSKGKYVLEWLAILASLTALIITLYHSYGDLGFTFNEEDQIKAKSLLQAFRTVQTRMIIVLVVAMLSIIFFAARTGGLLKRELIYFRRIKEVDTLKHSMFMINNVTDETKDFINYSIASEKFLIEILKKESFTEDEKNRIKKNIEEVKRKFEHYSIDVLNNIKNLFDVITRDETSVSVKYFKSLEELEKEDRKEDRKEVQKTKVKRDNADEVFAKTACRDSVSKGKRKDTDMSLNKYPAKSNSAFNEIIENGHLYFNEDLLKEKEKYRNSNPYWWKYYNACLVIGITYPNTITRSTHTAGALCIDNFKGGFKEELAQSIAKAVTNSYAAAYKEYVFFLSQYEDIIK